MRSSASRASRCRVAFSDHGVALAQAAEHAGEAAQHQRGDHRGDQQLDQGDTPLRLHRVTRVIISTGGSVMAARTQIGSASVPVKGLLSPSALSPS